jgi:integrase
MKAKLTKSFVNALEPDPDPTKRLTVWDTELPNFGITVTPKTTRGGGVKTYIVQYRPGGRGTPTRRVTIGRHGHEWQPDNARKEAAEIIRQRRKGVDPFEDRARQRRDEKAAQEGARVAEEASKRFVYDAFCEEFIEHYAKKKQPRSWKGTQRALKDLGRKLGACRLDQLERKTIAEALEALKARSPSAAIAAHKALRKLYNWAVAETIFTWHPLREMTAPAETTIRKRVLSPAELKAIWQGAVKLGYPFGFMYMLILATGLRLRDVANAVWGEHYPDHEALIIPAARMKRPPDDVRGDFLVPLNHYALLTIKSIPDAAPRGLLRVHDDRAPMFTATGRKPVSGFSMAKRALDAEIEEILGAPMPHWTTHDLRRTMATVMQPLRVPTKIIDRLQDHRDKEQSRTSIVYQHWEYIEEKREAAALYGDFLKGAIDDDPAHRHLAELVGAKLLHGAGRRAGAND